MVDKAALPLTRGLKELVLLFLPISLTTFSTCLFLFVEKIFLASYSTTAMEAAVNVGYVCQIFQAPCVALAMMAQVFVGRWFGANDYESIGPMVWQFIWFSLMSSIITFPLGLALGQFYFKGSLNQDIVFSYYYFLLAINFLFPLGTTLSCFYIGQGKTHLVLLTTVSVQLLKIGLAYLLIFGWDSWLPAWGMFGGALGTFVAQSTYCAILLFVFLNNKNREKFKTSVWRFKNHLFWECIYPGLLRAGNRILGFTCWASIAYLMSIKGGNYLLVLSVGGTLFLFLPFISEAICQAQITLVSQLLNTSKITLLSQSLQPALLLVSIILFFTGIPFLFFPKETFDVFFPTLLLDEKVSFNIALGVWLSFSFFTLSALFIAYILAFKDTLFSLFMGFFGWINGFLLIYVAIQYMHMPADLFWIVLSVMHGTTALGYYWRMKWLEKQALANALLS